MKLYFSTFISGTQEIVQQALEKRKGRFKIRQLFDGLIVYGSNYREQEIRNIRFFNNTFSLLKIFPEQKSLEKMIQIVGSDGKIFEEI